MKETTITCKKEEEDKCYFKIMARLRNETVVKTGVSLTNNKTLYTLSPVDNKTLRIHVSLSQDDNFFRGIIC